MDKEPIGGIQRQTVPELLDRPFRPGVVGDIPVHDPACADVKEHEDVAEIAVPAHERVGLHHGQELAPVDEWREENERNSRGVVRAPRPDLPLHVAGELLPEEQILGRQLRAGPGHQAQEAHQVSEESERRSKHVWR
jgi:hypothetical protein